MYPMANRRRGRMHRLLLAVISCVLAPCLSFSGCSRQQSLQPAGTTSSIPERALPFHAESQAIKDNSASPGLPDGSKPSDTKPFGDGSQRRMLAAGTLLTVQLRTSLSAAKVHPGDAFSAVVADPLTFGGKTLIEPGTPVTGVIESAKQETDQSHRFGYVEVALVSIDAGANSGANLSDGPAMKKIALQTSSLFVRATPRPSEVSFGSGSVRVRKGSRLTFRLIAPVLLDDGIPSPPRKMLSSAAE
jgi:hypothetical protein